MNNSKSKGSNFRNFCRIWKKMQNYDGNPWKKDHNEWNISIKYEISCVADSAESPSQYITANIIYI